MSNLVGENLNKSTISKKVLAPPLVITKVQPGWTKPGKFLLLEEVAQ